MELFRAADEAQLQTNWHYWNDCFAERDLDYWKLPCLALSATLLWLYCVQECGVNCYC